LQTVAQKYHKLLGAWIVVLIKLTISFATNEGRFSSFGAVSMDVIRPLVLVPTMKSK